MHNEEPSSLTRSENIELLDVGSENPNEEEGNGAVGNLHSLHDVEDDRFFDSRDHRICFNCIHAKICTFVLATWVLHSIILSVLYLLSMFEEIESKSTIFVILVCRVVQTLTIGLLYYGLWKHIKKFILPFIVAQFTLGIFADVSTLLIMIRKFEESGEFFLPFNETAKWLNVAFPLILYFAIVSFLVYVLYSCYNFLNARSLHDKRRQLDKEHKATLSSHFDLNGSGGATGFLQTRNDAVVPEGDFRSNSPALPQKTQNAIAMQSLSRTPSSQINPRSTKFTPEQLKLRQQLIRQRSGNNPTGSLQQLPSTSFGGRQPFVNPPTSVSGDSQRRLMSLSHSPYQRFNHEQSEPMLHLLSTKGPHF